MAYLLLSRARAMASWTNSKSKPISLPSHRRSNRYPLGYPYELCVRVLYIIS